MLSRAGIRGDKSPDAREPVGFLAGLNPAGFQQAATACTGLVALGVYYGFHEDCLPR